MKMLYKVIINWKGELHTFYSHAKNPRKALMNSIRRLADHLNILPLKIRSHILDGKDRYSVKEVISGSKYTK